MNLILLLVLVVAAGAVLSVQAAINGRLGQAVGVLRSSLLTFVVGAVSTGLLILFFEPAHAVSLLDVPKWQLTGALFGVVYMMVMVGASAVAPQAGRYERNRRIWSKQALSSAARLSMVPLEQCSWAPPRSLNERFSSKVAPSAILGPAAKRSGGSQQCRRAWPKRFH